MGGLIKSELIKGRRSVSRRCVVVFAILVTLMSIVLMGGRLSQIAAFNWWYMVIQPALLALLCMNTVESEKKYDFYNLLVLPEAKGRAWRGKVFAVLCSVLVANVLVFTFTTIGGFFFGSQFTLGQGIGAALVLTASIAWQIPLGMFLAVRFHSSFTLAALMGLNYICSSQPVAGGKLWYIPFAIPSRLMAPLLGVNPNGMQLETGDTLWNTNVIVPGLIVTLVLFIGGCAVTAIWFDRREK